jgi:hypothetical protein
MKEELKRPHPFNGLKCWHGRTIGHGNAFVELPTDESQIADIVAQWTSNDDCEPYADDPYEWSVAAVVRLIDGRYMSWETFQGATGNGFSEDAYGGEADIHFANDLETIVRFGLTAEGRENLGLQLPSGKS